MRGDTLTALSDFLFEPCEKKRGPVPVEFSKAVAMTLAYLGSKEVTYRCFMELISKLQVT